MLVDRECPGIRLRFKQPFVDVYSEIKGLPWEEQDNIHEHLEATGYRELIVGVDSPKELSEDLPKRFRVESYKKAKARSSTKW